MQKPELLAQLENAKNNYILGLAALAIFADSRTYPLLDEARCAFGPYSVEFSQVAALLRIEADRAIASKEFMNMLLRILIKESFELLKNHCAETGQAPLLHGQPWYEFARMIRNSLSHNFRLQFGKHDRSLLPVTWRGRTIELAMDGAHLELSFFGYVQAWELFADFRDFAMNRLAA
jgi:hypothetical protein